MSKKVLVVLAVVVAVILVVWGVKSSDKKMTSNDMTDKSAKLAAGWTALSNQSGDFVVNTEKSNVGWEGTKTLVVDYKDSGTIKIASGNLSLKDGVISNGEVVIDMKTISTESVANNGETSNLTKHLSSPDFFDVAKYPTATLKINSIAKSSTMEDVVDVTGDMTIKGITKPVLFPARVAVSEDGKQMTANASIVLDRTMWDIKFGSGKFFKDLGDKVIADEFTLTVSLIAEVK